MLSGFSEQRTSLSLSTPLTSCQLAVASFTFFSGQIKAQQFELIESAPPEA